MNVINSNFYMMDKNKIFFFNFFAEYCKKKLDWTVQLEPYPKLV